MKKKCGLIMIIVGLIIVTLTTIFAIKWRFQNIDMTDLRFEITYFPQIIGGGLGGTALMTIGAKIMEGKD